MIALKEAGCSVVFQEQVSTRVKEENRPQFQAALSSLESGDELVVAKLDRLGRTQVEVVSRLHHLQQEGIHVRTLDNLVNTKGLGKFAPVLIGLLSSLAEVERSLLNERVQESIAHRKATGGNLGGRPKTNAVKERLVLRLREEGCSYRSIREQTGLALSTIRRIIIEWMDQFHRFHHFQTMNHLPSARRTGKRHRLVDSNGRLLNLINS